MANGMGVHVYIEPQCFKDPKYKKDKKSDIYSLGVLFWELSSGCPPFIDFSRELLGHHIGIMGLRETPVENTPLEYQDLYQQCWNGEPDLRPDINKVYEELNKLKSQFDSQSGSSLKGKDPNESQTTQDSSNNDDPSFYGDSLRIANFMDENLNQNQDGKSI